MSDEKKKSITDTAVDRKIGDAIEKVLEAQAKRDAAQDEALTRPSVVLRAVKMADPTLRYPIPFSLAGLAFIAGGVAKFEGAKMWTLVGVGILLVPGLAGRAIEFVGGLKKAKGE